MITEQRRAVIYGITGQDGSYLAEMLCEKGYMVIGVARRASTSNEARIQHLFSLDNFELVEGDITDSGSVFSIIGKHCPDEIYNLAAQSHVGTSFNQPYYTFQVDALGELNILEAIRTIYPYARHYFAGSSEEFGNNYTVLGDKKFQDEETPFAPASPYAAAKVAAHHLVQTYRKSYGLHASVGILFNHESPRRGDQFVTKKIINWIKDFIIWTEAEGFLCNTDLEFDGEYISSPLTKSKFPKLRLGNIKASRDWGFAGDYVRAMWLMLQQDEPDDYVIATGDTYTVEEFLEEAFAHADINDDFHKYIHIDPKFYRPNDVEYLRGKPTKAMHKLGWFCEVSFTDLVRLMFEGESYVSKEKISQKVV